MIFSPNVSRVDEGVHGHQAIVIGSLCITTVDHGAQEGKGCTTPFAPCHMTDWSFAHARPERNRARARVAQYVREAQMSFLIEWNKWKNHFYKMKGDVGMSGHEKERKQEDAYTKIQTHS